MNTVMSMRVNSLNICKADILYNIRIEMFVTLFCKILWNWGFVCSKIMVLVSAVNRYLDNQRQTKWYPYINLFRQWKRGIN